MMFLAADDVKSELSVGTAGGVLHNSKTSPSNLTQVQANLELCICACQQCILGW